MYWGCKRRKQTARWLYPEKEEYGVFFREDRGEAMIAIPAKFFINLISDSTLINKYDYNFVDGGKAEREKNKNV